MNSKHSICIIACFMLLLCVHVVDAQHMDVQTSDNEPLIIKGASSLTNTFYEDGQIRGYFGSRYGNFGDIDMGVDPLNPSGKFHLTIQGIPQLTINANGKIGIGTTTPGQHEILTINNGNLLLNNSDRGIFLDAGTLPDILEGPIITRGLNQFNSGPFQGVGRWGLFMTTSRLILGIPNMNGKGFEFASYEEDGSRNSLLTILKNKKVTRPATSTKDLLPIALGSVNSDGAVLGGTGNFSVSRQSAGNYILTIDNESNSFYNNYLINATVSDGFGVSFYITATHRFDPDGFIVRIFTITGAFIDKDFHFVIHRVY